MKSIELNTKKYSLVENYSEMNKSQFLQICYLYSQFLVKTTPEEYDALRIQAFYVLSGIPLKYLKQIESAQWVDIFPHVNYVFEDVPSVSKNMLPSLKIGLFRKRLYGPIGMCENLTLFEMMEADTAFIAASNFQNIDKIYLLASILYRPKRSDLRKFKKSKKWNYDIREEYNQKVAEERIKLMKKVPMYKLVAIFIFYLSFRNKELVNSPILEPIFKGKDKNMGLTIGWLGTLLAVSDGVFGTLDETKEQNWKLVLVKLANDLTVRENQDIEANEARIRQGFKN